MTRLPIFAKLPRMSRIAAASFTLSLIAVAGPAFAQAVAPPAAPAKAKTGPRFDVNGDGVGDTILDGTLYLGRRDGKLVAAGAGTVAAGDVNADGFSDVLVVAPKGKQVSLFLGGAAGLAKTPAFVIEPPSPTRTFGDAASAAGDVNHDGFGDVIIGAPGIMEAYVYLGSKSGLAAKPASTIKKTSKHEHSNFGAVVCGVGDVNGDGFGDVTVSASGPNELYLFPGSAQGVSDAPLLKWFGGGDTQFPSELVAPGDVDGDGLADIAYTDVQPGSNTHVPTLVRGSRGKLNPDAKGAPIPGYLDGDVDLRAAGDVNGDGFADVLFRPLGETKVYLLSGGKGGFTGRPRAFPIGGEPEALAAGDDLNGDGFADLLVRLKGKELRLVPGGPKGYGKAIKIAK